MNKKKDSSSNFVNTLTDKSWKGIVFCLVMVILFNTAFNLQKQNNFHDETYQIIMESSSEEEYNIFSENTRSDIFIKPFIDFINPEIIVSILNIVLLILSLILAGLIAHKTIPLFMYILGLSSFIVLQSYSLTDNSFILFFIALGLYGIFKSKLSYTLISLFFISYLSPLTGLISAILLSYYLYKNNLHKKNSIFLFISWLISLFFILTVPKFTLSNNLLSYAINDFGGVMGISLTMITMSIIAVFVLNYRINFVNMLILLAIPGLFIDIKASLLILNICFIIYVSLLTQSLLKRQWNNNIMKYLSLAFLFLIVLFSGISEADRLDENKLPQNFYDSLDWLEENTVQNSTILTHYFYGSELEYYSSKESYIDSTVFYSFEAKNKIEQVNTIFHSRNKNNIISFLDSNHISYILITDDMKNGLVWERDNQGMVFVMNTNPEFTLIYNNTYSEIWWYNSPKNNIDITTDD